MNIVYIYYVNITIAISLFIHIFFIFISQALFSSQKLQFLATVALLFLFDKHCPIMK